jgi:hypothetical protein
MVPQELVTYDCQLIDTQLEPFVSARGELEFPLQAAAFDRSLSTPTRVDFLSGESAESRDGFGK